MCTTMDGGVRMFYKILLALIVFNKFSAVTNHVVKRSLAANLNSLTTYKYGYDVQDHRTGDYKMQEEERDGDKVKGMYRVADPDGSMRTIRYTVDKTGGFRASVTRDNIEMTNNHPDANNQQQSTAFSKNRLQLAEYPSGRYTNNLDQTGQQSSSEKLQQNPIATNNQLPAYQNSKSYIPQNLHDSNIYPHNPHNYNSHQNLNQEITSYSNNQQPEIRVSNNDKVIVDESRERKHEITQNSDLIQQLNSQSNNRNQPTYKITQTYHGINSDQPSSSNDQNYDQTPTNAELTQTPHLKEHVHQYNAHQQGPIASALKQEIGGYHKVTNSGVGDYQQADQNIQYKTPLFNPNQITEIASKLIPEEYRIPESYQNSKITEEINSGIQSSDYQTDRNRYSSPTELQGDKSLHRLYQQREIDSDKGKFVKYISRSESPESSQFAEVSKYLGKPETENGKYLQEASNQESLATNSDLNGKYLYQTSNPEGGVSKYLKRPEGNEQYLQQTPGISKFLLQAPDNYLLHTSNPESSQFIAVSKNVVQAIHPEIVNRNPEVQLEHEKYSPENSGSAKFTEYLNQLQNSEPLKSLPNGKYLSDFQPNQQSYTMNVQKFPEQNYEGKTRETHIPLQLIRNVPSTLESQRQMRQEFVSSQPLLESSRLQQNGHFDQEQNQISSFEGKSQMQLQAITSQNALENPRHISHQQIGGLLESKHFPLQLIRNVPSTLESQRQMRQEYISSQPLFESSRLQQSGNLLEGHVQNQIQSIPREVPLEGKRQMQLQAIATQNALEYQRHNSNQQISGLLESQRTQKESTYQNIAKFMHPERLIQEQHTNRVAFPHPNQIRSDQNQIKLQLVQDQPPSIENQGWMPLKLIQNLPAFLANGQDISKSVQLAFQKHYQQKTALQKIQEAKSTQQAQVVHYAQPEIKQPATKTQSYYNESYFIPQPEQGFVPPKPISYENVASLQSQYSHQAPPEVNNQMIGTKYIPPREQVKYAHQEYQIKSERPDQPHHQMQSGNYFHQPKTEAVLKPEQVKYGGWQGSKLQEGNFNPANFYQGLQSESQILYNSKRPEVVRLPSIYQQGQQTKSVDSGTHSHSYIQGQYNNEHVGNFETYPKHYNKEGAIKLLTYAKAYPSYSKTADEVPITYQKIQPMKYGRASRQSPQSPHPTIDTPPAIITNHIGYDKNVAINLFNHGNQHQIKEVPAYHHVLPPKHRQVFDVMNLP